MPGTRRITMSRVAPPPTAEIVPSSSAANQPSPTASVLCAPVAAQHPSASASTMGHTQFQMRPSTRNTNAIAAPASAVSR